MRHTGYLACNVKDGLDSIIVEVLHNCIVVVEETKAGVK
jgi:hypothetical protein